MEAWSQRLFAALGALLLGWGIFTWFSGAHSRYWILRDGAQVTALINDEGSHGTVYYTYSVSGRQYLGHSQRELRSQVGIGGQSSVWYSSSHTWLSLLKKPQSTLYALPWVVVALAFESQFFIALVASRKMPLFDLEPTSQH